MKHLFEEEHVLTPEEAARCLEYRLHDGKYCVADDMSFDRDLIAHIADYRIGGSEDEQIAKTAREAVSRLCGEVGGYSSVTVEALLCIDRDYFERLIDASYSQDTQAQDKISNGLAACEGFGIEVDGRMGKVFTTDELMESGKYIVDEYFKLQHSVKNMDARSIKNRLDGDTVTVEAVAHAPIVKMEQMKTIEPMPLDFGEAVEQLSLDLDNGLEK